MIESKQNQQVKLWKKLQKKKYREQEKKFLVEGWHLVEEVTKSNWVIDTLIVEENVVLPKEWSTYHHVYVTKSVFKELAHTDSPQGIMAIVNFKKWDTDETYQRLLFVDAVQDPGNVGTIIRSALAFQIDAVVIGKGSVDLFHDKVVRATQGALFHLPIFRDELYTWLDLCKKKKIKTFATALDEKATPLYAIKNIDRYAIIVGNEGRGICEDILEAADEKIYIPIAQLSESLNVGVATSIALYHFNHAT